MPLPVNILDIFLCHQYTSVNQNSIKQLSLQSWPCAEVQKGLWPSLCHAFGTGGFQSMSTNLEHLDIRLQGAAGFSRLLPKVLIRSPLISGLWSQPGSLNCASLSSPTSHFKQWRLFYRKINKTKLYSHGVIRQDGCAMMFVKHFKHLKWIHGVFFIF